MANPAQLLHATLERWSGNNQHSAQDARGLSEPGDSAAMIEHRIAMKQLSQIEELLGSLAAAGRRVAQYQQQIPQWQSMIMAIPFGWTSAQPPFNQSSLAMLELLVDRLEDFVPAPTEDQRGSLSEIVSEIFQLLDEDNTLPADLHRHVWLVANHARTCLDEYNALGDFELQTAIDRLLVAVDRATNQTEHAGKWEAVRTKFMYPFTVGTTVALANPIILQAIESTT